MQQMRYLPRYEYHETNGIIEVSDPVWGDFRIGQWPGDEIFGELYLNPLVQRSAGIEQLTLPEHFCTMPGSADMSRWEHVWGSVGFVRTVIKHERSQGAEISDREALRLQLRTFVSDLGHTAFSHLGDWLFQGYGGAEDQHDDELMEILEVGGVNDILRKHGFEPEEVVFPDEEDWIESPSPDLCVDRVDYGHREILRWVDNGIQPWTRPEMFQLDDAGRLIMASKEDAKRFGVAFSLLSTEHWAHPVHRLQLKLFGELIRSVIVEDEDHPRDELYAVDSSLITKTKTANKLNYNLHALMLDIARSQRRIFAHGREREINRFIRTRRTDSAESPDFPDPMQSYSWLTQVTDVKPHNIAIVEVEKETDVPDFGKLPYTLDVSLPAMKPRHVDPLYYDETGEIQRLSEVDEEYFALLAAQKIVQAKAYVARVYADPTFLDALKHQLEAVEEGWKEALQGERLTPEERTFNIRTAGTYAIALNKYIHLRD